MSARIHKMWQSYRVMVVSDDAGEVQVNETRQAFYAGASALFYGILGALDEGTEETEADMEFMNQLQQEIDRFGEQLDQRYLGSIKLH